MMLLLSLPRRLQWVRGTRAAVSAGAREHCLPQDLRLQWVRGTRAAVSWDKDEKEKARVKLQWVRGTRAAVSPRARDPHGREERASMGPRHAGRGIARSCRPGRGSCRGFN